MNKTIPCWEFWTCYSGQKELEVIEFSRAAMIENRKAYRDAGVPVTIKPRRFHLREFAYEFVTNKEYDSSVKEEAGKYLDELIAKPEFRQYVKEKIS